MKRLQLIVPLLLLLASCESMFDSKETIRGEGNVISEERILLEFSTVQSTIGANINIIESHEHAIKVTLQKNLIPYLVTNVKSNSLNIYFDDVNIRTDSVIIIDIYTPSIAEYTLTGAGNTFSELPIGHVKLTGAGNIKCNGAAEEVKVLLSGAGNIKLFNMPVNTADIKITGAGDVEVDVKDQLEVTISGVGNVYYKGNPLINQTISGVGQVIGSN